MLLLRCWFFTLRKQEKKNFKKITLYHHHLIVRGEGEGGDRLFSRGRWGGGINGLLSHPSLYLNPSPLTKPPPPPSSLPSPTMNHQQFFSSNNFLWREHLKWKATPCCVLIQFLTSFDFKFDWVSRTNRCLLTSSILSGSDADASHLLCTMKMFGLGRCWFTLWKNFFSCKWQGYQLRNCPTSIGRLNLGMLPQWTCNKSHFKATEILKKVPSNLNFVCVVS